MRAVVLAMLVLAGCESDAERVIRLDREVSRAYLSTISAQRRLDSVMAAHPAYDAHPYFAPFRDSLLVAQAREARLRAELARAMGGH